LFEANNERGNRMTKHPTPAKCQAGFTLVELAIVMIIIGLLIGGVLKGQQLITNAQITATVAQIKAIDAATTSFKDQYANLPGDMLTPNARIPNCPAAGSCGIPGNGDGKIEQAAFAAVTFAAAPTLEQLGYWAQLNAAGLLTGINPDQAGTTATAWGQYAPASKINGGGFDVGWNGGGALFPAQSGGVAANNASGTYLALHGTAGAPMAATIVDGFMKPNYAARIDTKIDDGIGNTGTVLSGGMAATAAGGTGCVVTIANNVNVYNESASGAACSLYILFQN
jgi:prepilin-type N-terminal cleavage/methylation domain-containing protein